MPVSPDLDAFMTFYRIASPQKVEYMSHQPQPLAGRVRKQ